MHVTFFCFELQIFERFCSVLFFSVYLTFILIHKFLDNKSNFWCKAKRENYWSDSLTNSSSSYLSAAEALFLGECLSRHVIDPSHSRCCLVPPAIKLQTAPDVKGFFIDLFSTPTITTGK
ncbi:hypothetical protein NPIL_214911 [Nephila pilipes]|uniref:Uncharacterized protein n=1 Tax=Nephila pilipes TaxID=299642 RepID=A0A8X6TEZ4_NEPPI|nr:hypothetical protein NPIL_214911 [Nephila pilipes]